MHAVIGVRSPSVCLRSLRLTTQHVICAVACHGSIVNRARLSTHLPLESCRCASAPLQLRSTFPAILDTSFRGLFMPNKSTAPRTPLLGLGSVFLLLLAILHTERSGSEQSAGVDVGLLAA